MKHYFSASDVPTDKQVSVLLSLFGFCVLVNNLLSSISLDNYKLDEIVKVLTNQYEPKKS